MAAVKVTVSGAEEYRRALQRLPPELLRELDRLFDEATRQGYVTARAAVPVRTGRLRASIVSRRQTMLGYTLEASAPYAGYVEYGTSRMTARPYIRPGMRAVRDYLRQSLPGRLAEMLRRLRVG